MVQHGDCSESGKMATFSPFVRGSEGRGGKGGAKKKGDLEREEKKFYFYSNVACQVRSIVLFAVDTDANLTLGQT